MAKKKIFPKISPEFIKDKNGKVASVILKYGVYSSILDEMDHLKKNIERLKKLSQKKKKAAK
jgi:hypothetical protein